MAKNWDSDFHKLLLRWWFSPHRILAWTPFVPAHRVTHFLSPVTIGFRKVSILLRLSCDLHMEILSTRFFVLTHVTLIHRTYFCHPFIHPALHKWPKRFLVQRLDPVQPKQCLRDERISDLHNFYISTNWPSRARCIFTSLY